MVIYAISGLGADERVFKYLNLDYPIVPIPWIEPLKNEDISEYALRLSKTIDSKQDFALLGVSFGGMIAVEINKIVNPKLTILISSIETKYQLPSIYKWFGKMGFVKYLPKQTFKMPKSLAKYVFGAQNKALLYQILDDTDLHFTKWAIQQVLKWNNTQKPKNCICIQGSRDKLLPAYQGENVKLINKGTHFMIVDKADEVSQLINICLQTRR